MLRSEDYLLSLLLQRFRSLPAERLRAPLAAAARRGASLAQALTGERLLPPEELGCFAEAAAYLAAGHHAYSCAACALQAFVLAGPGGACARCRRPLVHGVLSAPAAVAFAPDLERHLRRMLAAGLARKRRETAVLRVNRLRAEGKIGRRPEGDLAPADRACTEPTLGDYRLLRELGRGGSSYVYQAEDRRDGRIVALKALYFRAEEGAEVRTKKLARFRREAELAGRLDHPNLVPAEPIEEVGAWHLIPMLYVDGPTLAQVLDARREERAPGEPEAPRPGLDLRGLTDALGDVAKGLHYAHCRGVIHRDVTPRNILFSAAGDVYLGDFGCSRSITGRSDLTGKDVLGTGHYIAPERLESEARADAQSDIYSLGVILCEILSRCVPPRRRAADPAVPADPAAAVAEEEEETAAAPPLPPAVLAGLLAVGKKATEYEPARRYATALDFEHALSACWEGAEGGAELESTPAGAGLPGAGRGPASRLRRALGPALAFLAGAVLSGLLGAWTPPGAAGSWTAALEREWARMLAAGTDPEYLDRRRAFEVALAGSAGGPPASPAAEPFRRARYAWSQGDLAGAEQGFGSAATAAVDGADGADGELRRAALLGQGIARVLLADRHRDVVRARSGGGAGAAASPAAAVCDQLKVISAECAGRWEARLADALRAALEGTGESAVAALERLGREEPARPEPALLAAWLRLRTGDPAAALRVLDGTASAPAGAARGYDPFVRWVEIAARVALGGAGGGTHAAPAAAAQAMTRLWPRMVEAHLVAGEALLDAGRPADALAALDRGLELDPRALDGLRLRARALQQLDDPYPAIVTLTQLLELDPQAERILFQRAQVFLRLGDRFRAQRDFRSYVERFPAGAYVERALTALAGE